MTAENSRFFSRLLQTLMERGRSALSLRGLPYKDAAQPHDLAALCRRLLTSGGETSGRALAQTILDGWLAANAKQKLAFFMSLLNDFDIDETRLDAAIDAYRGEKAAATLAELQAAAEPRRQELIRRLNAAPNGIATLVEMRAALLKQLAEHPSLKTVDADFHHLFASWFNPGFLVLAPIDWSTPANILEKIIRYEAVHEIKSWDDLRRRLAPPDRRCFAFFHPRLPDEPLIFVEVALTQSVPGQIAELLRDNRNAIDPNAATTAVFYSISNCQVGLRGISFGNFLIKQVVQELRRNLPNLKHFVTLSPVPGFAAWLRKEREAASPGLAALRALDTEGWQETAGRDTVEPVLFRAAARYFLEAKNGEGKPVDPVARFHLGNGARLERLNFLADKSPRGLNEAHGLMVNYLYDLDHIDANHEAFALHGHVVAAPAIRQILEAKPKSKFPLSLRRGRKSNA